MTKTARITFARNTLEFYPELKRRVDSYFKSRNLTRNANWAMIIKSIVILTAFFGSYAAILLLPLPGWALLGLAAFLGLSAASLGMNIGHDALHGAFSGKRVINKVFGSLFNFIGADDYVWKIRHNIMHHTYTNIPGHDDDIEQVGLIRLHEGQKKRWIHRFQHIYVFLLYPMAPFPWVFYADFKNFFRRSWGNYQNRPKRKDIIKMFGFKALNFFLFIALPLLVIDQPWYWIIAGIALYYMVIGFVLSFIFQLAHVVNETEFKEPDATGRVPDAWAIHQLQTTADFAPTNKLVSFLAGGLNFQVEHHLFPQVCHIHYPKLRPIVQQTATEFGLRHIENSTFRGAVRSHLRHLKGMGRG